VISKENTKLSTQMECNSTKYLARYSKDLEYRTASFPWWIQYKWTDWW